MRLLENLILVQGALSHLKAIHRVDGRGPHLSQGERIAPIVILSQLGQINVLLVPQKVQPKFLLEDAWLPFSLLYHLLEGLDEDLSGQLLRVPHALQAEILVHFDHEDELAVVEEGRVGENQLAAFDGIGWGEQALHEPPEGLFETTDIFE